MNEPQPTEGELAILRILWRRGEPATVREVHDELLQVKDTAYTTVLKMLTIMAEKALVGRDESERSHRYFALYSEPLVETSMLKNFLRNAFSGSAYKLVQRAIDTDTASDEELDAIGKLIADAKQRRMK
ncbi:BlaI/MecI/CopY family transcriptional regulator [Pseudoduganella sp. SL102]|uniref:BlaI/MecI/CopY family transcriptional regulator n=1 Tax=Pseudoduganella sp. SL102 TaxID=2995154 RepID=UPI00248C2AE5|nr:BlaI/MecI/CopY family transcriptional regulator [Pseudoduganella sp. SL102]WBS03724.1 BlaI/MecI/CopY family transcriptional regulator [Pseudoduganella sp. SL102]